VAGFWDRLQGWAAEFGRFLLAAVIVLLAAVGTMLAFRARLLTPDTGGAALLMIAGGALLVYLIQRPWLRVGLVAVAHWIPLVAAAGTVVTLFVIPPTGYGTRSVAVLVGLLGAAIAWLAATMFLGRRSTPETANSRAYANIMERARSIRARIEVLEHCESDGDDCTTRVCLTEAKAHIEYVDAALDPEQDPKSTSQGHTWASGSGYQSLWTAIHRADEALIGCLDAAGLRREILRDLLRLRTSKLDSKLSAELKEIRDRLPKSETPAAQWALRELAGKVQVVRRAINEFQDGRWDGLVNARTGLSRSTLITAWTAYVIGVLAVTLSATREALAVAAVYFGVGALVGLMAQLRSDAKKEQVVEDYGLSAARVHQLVLASGLAGVGGVVLMAIGADVSTTGSTGAVELASIFNAGVKPAPLLVAAVFGLSPSLLLDRIASKADTYKEDLSTIQVGVDEPSGSVDPPV
jgi:hypothetical protein